MGPTFSTGDLLGHGDVVMASCGALRPKVDKSPRLRRETPEAWSFWGLPMRQGFLCLLCMMMFSWGSDMKVCRVVAKNMHHGLYHQMGCLRISHGSLMANAT